jgi:ubiquinone biosynthesis protein
MATPFRRAYDNVRSGQAVLRDVGRLRQIVTVLLGHGFGAFVQRLALQDHWITNKLLELRHRVADREAAREADMLPLERRFLLVLQDLGPTFIKLGQMLSTRPDLFPPALIQELQTLQDNVPPLPLAAVRAVISGELGDDVEALFDDFNPEPLATASIAQVHAARLKDSATDVVVKVQRPNIEPQIAADVEIMGFLARALEANFPETRIFSPTGIVAEFEKAILKEIDFSNELDNLERFQRNFADDTRVHFPQPYPELSTRRVLTMERIHAIKITQITAERFDIDAVMRTWIDAVLQMIFADGFFHGDLHPGNVFVRDDGTVCFLDVGLCGRLSPRQRDLVTDLLVAAVQQDWEAVARRFWAMTVHGKDSTADYRTFEADVVECAERWFGGKTLAEVEFTRIFTDLINLSLRHRIRMPPDYTMTFKAVITMEGVGKQLRPNMDLLGAARPYVTRLLAERYNPRRLLESGYAALRDLAEVLGTLPETTRAILEDLHAGRTQINIASDQVDQIHRNYAHTQHRTVIGALAGTSALCGTLALGYGTYAILGLPVLSFWFYALAAALGGWYLLLGRQTR